MFEVEVILNQSASALEKLHSAGMVHLDVKPANLIQTPDGTIKLIDFGLAQQADQTQELLHGMAYGSAAYLSPEQAAGEQVDGASDVYSLGCVVYELLTGRTPFEDPYRTRSVGGDGAGAPQSATRPPIGCQQGSGNSGLVR